MLERHKIAKKGKADWSGGEGSRPVCFTLNVNQSGLPSSPLIYLTISQKQTNLPYSQSRIVHFILKMDNSALPSNLPPENVAMRERPL